MKWMNRDQRCELMREARLDAQRVDEIEAALSDPELAPLVRRWKRGHMGLVELFARCFLRYAAAIQPPKKAA